VEDSTQNRLQHPGVRGTRQMREHGSLLRHRPSDELLAKKFSNSREVLSRSRVGGEVACHAVRSMLELVLKDVDLV